MAAAGMEGSRTRLSIYDGLVLLLVAALTAITVLAVLRPGDLFLAHSAALQNTISTASLLIGLGAAYVALGEFLLYGRFSSLCIGLAFLIFLSADATLGVVPLLTGWQRHLTWLPYGLATDQVAGGVLLVAAGLLVDANIPVSRRVRTATEGIAVVLIFSLLVAAWIYGMHDQAVSSAPSAVPQLMAGVLFFLASALFYRVSRVYRRTWFVWLSLSLVIAGFAQLQFALRQYPVGYVQAGDILRLLFFTGILIWLAADWSQNYRRLRWQTRQLEALHALMTAPVIRNVAEVQAHIERVVGDALNGRASLLVGGRDALAPRDPLNAQMLEIAAQGSDGDGVDMRRIVVGFDEDAGDRVAMGVTLRSSERRLGMLIVSRGNREEFSAYDLRLLRAFGDQASMLLERSLLYQEVEAGAILQERSRLAREIHDGLAQHLAFLKMRVAWLRRVPSGPTAAQLQEIESVLETALIEARHAITTLRAEPQGASTAEAITAYAEEFGQVSGLEVSGEAKENVPEVGPKTRVELLRIVQEALNNVRKHAGATRVRVLVAPESDGAAVTICDNGQGFPQDQDLQGHFGLEIMRERAESVGGRLEVESVPGQGTTVRVWVPVGDAEGEPAQPDSLRLAQR